MVVQHLLSAIAAFVAPVRERATHTFTSRVEKAQAQFGEVRGQVRAEAADVQETSQDQWSVALSAYAKALDKAGTAAQKAADQRLREVRAYAKIREATVRHIQYVYQQKLRSGNVAAAAAYRKQALADLAKTDGAFAARIGAERDHAAAAYQTATGVAKQELERVRAMVTDAQALAEATVVVDPATLPADPGPPMATRRVTPADRRSRRQSVAASSTSTSIGVPSPAATSTRSPVILPALRRSPRAPSIATTAAAGPVIVTLASSARIDTLALDLAPRIPVSAAATASSVASSTDAAEPKSAAVGHACVWIEPSCHHDQTSSVT
jgi:hypothetical protein